jgi:DNA-binding beta-propeller fold protein YncE
MRRRTALLALALLAAGCSERARLNPFDPANPDTGGRPAGFVAIAGNQSVRLSWDYVSSPTLAGYQLFRLAPGDTAYRALSGVLPPSQTNLGDFGLLNGADHRYRLYFVFDGGLGALPAEDIATPGPLRAWVADYGARELARLSADCRHVADAFEPTGGAYPVAVDVSAATGRVWAVGPAGDVFVYEPGSGNSSVIGQTLGTLGAVAVDPADSSAWVGDVGDGRLVHLLPSGASADPPVLTALGYPGSIAIDAANRSIWVVEQDSNRVRRYTADGALACMARVDQPSRVAVDPVTHEAWVTSFYAARVVRVSAGGALLDTVTACAGPIGVAVDAGRRRVWVADGGADRVVALAMDGSVALTITGQQGARELAVDPATGEAWVTLGAAGAVSRLSPAGQELARAAGLASPWGIALDDVTRR